jgi:hypothetical protein
VDDHRCLSLYLVQPFSLEPPTVYYSLQTSHAAIKPLGTYGGRSPFSQSNKPITRMGALSMARSTTTTRGASSSSSSSSSSSNNLATATSPKYQRTKKARTR